MKIDLQSGVNCGVEAVYHRGMVTKVLTTFGERVIWLLGRADMFQRDVEPAKRVASQKELARAMEISPQYLNALVKGKSTPNVRHVTLAAKALGTTVDYLTLANDDPTPPAEEADALPIYFSAQADEAARIIDDLKDDAQRDFALALVRQVAAYVGAGVERELVPVTERKNIPAQIEPVPGAMGARFILGDKSGR
jgi:transcriptional regulator with XRE-family HTH domain